MSKQIRNYTPVTKDLMNILKHKRARSLFLLLLLSFIPFTIVMYIWYTMPDDIGVAGIIYVLGIPMLLPFILAIIWLVYWIVNKVFRIAKLPIYLVILVPLFINIVSTQWYFITVAIARAKYFSQYNGLNLDIKLVEGKVTAVTDQAYNFAAEYNYQLNAHNFSNKSFNNLTVDAYLTYNSFDEKESLGFNLLKANIKPGDNILENKMLLNTYTLKCRYIKTKSPLKLVIIQSILERKIKTVIPLEPILRERLLTIYNNLESINKGAPYPLPECGN